MRRALFAILLLALTGPVTAQGDVKLPMRDGSVKFAVLGDTGTGGSDQLAVAKIVTAYRTTFPFDFALLLGDNFYGGESPRDYARKFEVPYKALIDGGVTFHAARHYGEGPDGRFGCGAEVRGKQSGDWHRG